MDKQEIRMRCLEAAQAATKTPSMATPEVIIRWAGQFEAFVVGNTLTAEPQQKKAA